jgi:hypothetical protein
MQSAVRPPACLFTWQKRCGAGCVPAPRGTATDDGYAGTRIASCRAHPLHQKPMLKPNTTRESANSPNSASPSELVSW